MQKNAKNDISCIRYKKPARGVDMEFVNMFLHAAVIFGIIRLGLAVREMSELLKMVMYERDLPDDLKHHLEG